ncbi:MAG TPA: DUF6599 family protein [Syntrophobacteria bacterium]|nr:DUF6599 family protein [Syntrophobacteria bacterium]
MARTPGKTESLIGYAILLVLVVIAGGLFLAQSHYNAAVLTPSALQPESSYPSAVPRPDLGALAPEGLAALSPPESFGPETLSEKIDGKAELYLAAGFVQLLTQRFSQKGNPQAWLELFLYDMGSSRNAFAVYSVQRREDGQTVDLGDFAYKTEDALFLVHGQYYVEIIAPALGKGAAEILSAFGRGVVEKVKATRQGMGELALFPAAHLKGETISLLAADAFGFDRFRSVFTAQYRLGDTELTAFLSQQARPAEAAELAAAYHQFLLQNGGKEVKPGPGLVGVRMVELFGTYELVFSEGSVLAGVHGAEKKAAAEELARILKQRLSGVGT